MCVKQQNQKDFANVSELWGVSDQVQEKAKEIRSVKGYIKSQITASNKNQFLAIHFLACYHVTLSNDGPFNMSKLMFIEASPRQRKSVSSQIGKEFLKSYQATHAHDEITKMHLWEIPLEEFKSVVLEAKYAILYQYAFDAIQSSEWDKIKKLFDEFSSADKYVFCIPMWNFSIPYKLKHYIDLLTQPTLAFNFIPGKGYEGLLKNKKAMLIYSSGGSYASKESQYLDMQKPFMRLWLQFIGITDQQELVCQPTLIGKPEEIQKNIQYVSQRAIELAKTF